MKKRVYRSTENSKIAGVCGGIADYFDIDPVIPRLLAVLLVLADGVGLIAYIIAWIVIPKQTQEQEAVQVTEKKEANGFWNSTWPGVILVAVGGLLMLHKFTWWFDFHYFLWPGLLIAAGAFLIYNSRKKDTEVDEIEIKPEEVS